MRVTTYVFIEKIDKLSLNYPQYLLLSGALYKVHLRPSKLHHRVSIKYTLEYL